VHMDDVPSLDPRTWTVMEAGGRRSEVGSQPPSSSLQPPVAVAIDILDEDHSLRLAMRRLADDGALRAQLGTAARDWWSRTHTPDLMADDYERIIAEAIARPAPEAPLPPHMRNAGDGLLRGIVASFGLRSPLDS